MENGQKASKIKGLRGVVLRRVKIRIAAYVLHVDNFSASIIASLLNCCFLCNGSFVSLR